MVSGNIGVGAVPVLGILNSLSFDDLVKSNVWVENFSYQNAVERFSEVTATYEEIAK